MEAMERRLHENSRIALIEKRCHIMHILDACGKHAVKRLEPALVGRSALGDAEDVRHSVCAEHLVRKHRRDTHPVLGQIEELGSPDVAEGCPDLAGDAHTLLSERQACLVVWHEHKRMLLAGKLRQEGCLDTLEEQRRLRGPGTRLRHGQAEIRHPCLDVEPVCKLCGS